MRLPMISFKLFAVSLMGMQLVTQAFAIPINKEHSKALKPRLIPALIVGGAVTYVAHRVYKNHKKIQKSKQEKEKTENKSGKPEDKKPADKKSEEKKSEEKKPEDKKTEAEEDDD